MRISTPFASGPHHANFLCLRNLPSGSNESWISMMVDWASKRTAQLITQLAGGKVAAGVIDIYPKKSSAKQVTLRLEPFAETSRY